MYPPERTTATNDLKLDNANGMETQSNNQPTLRRLARTSASFSCGARAADLRSCPDSQRQATINPARCNAKNPITTKKNVSTRTPGKNPPPNSPLSLR